MLALTKAYAKELAPHGIRVNAVSPGHIGGTPFHKTFTAPEVFAATVKTIRLGRAGTPEDVILVAGMTQIGYYSRPLWPVTRPRSYLTSSYSGNLGYEYPVALGAKVACPDRPVIAVVGDGGFLYNAQELGTAVQHGINVVAVVFNDNAYGNVARDLDEAWGGSYGADLHNPDFIKLADAYGVTGMRAREPLEVGRLQIVYRPEQRTFSRSRWPN